LWNAAADALLCALPAPMHFNEAYDPFRALKSSWEILKAAPASILIGGLLLWVCGHGAGVGFQFESTDVEIDASDVDSLGEGFRVAQDVVREVLSGFGLLIALAAFSFAVTVWLFRCLVEVGLAGAVERVLVTGEDDLGDLFRPRGRWGTYVLATLLGLLFLVLAALPGLALGGLGAAVAYTLTQERAAVPIAFGAVTLLYLPVLVYVGLGISLARYAVACEGLGVTEAFSRSWELVRGRRWTLFLYHVVFLLTELCCCLWCFLFVPTSLIETAKLDSYLRLTHAGEPRTWGTEPRADAATPPA
jgi:hypothetical protein